MLEQRRIVAELIGRAMRAQHVEDADRELERTPARQRYDFHLLTTRDAPAEPGT